MKAAANLRRNIKTAAMDEIQTALYKATADDKLAPKEKHVLTLERLVGEGEASAEHVDGELAKRLSGCRSPRSACVAAKALVVLHRLVIAGHADVLREAARALATVCSAPQERNAQAEYVTECAAYLRALCAWGGAGGLRGDADWHAGWHGATPRDVLRALPQLQQLTAKAVELAGGGRFGNGALHALRHAVIEDALCLFRAQSAGAAAVHSGLLSLPTSLAQSAADGARAYGGVVVGGAGGAGALDVLDFSAALTRKALALHTRCVRISFVSTFVAHPISPLLAIYPLFSDLSTFRLASPQADRRVARRGGTSPAPRSGRDAIAASDLACGRQRCSGHSASRVLGSRRGRDDSRLA